MADLILFVIALSILVVVHELGHFVAAKLTKTKVEEFGLGIPPKIWGKRRGETEWSLNALPIGGFVRLYGENPDAGDEKQSVEWKRRSFVEKNPWQKLLIVIGGVMMNVVAAVAIFAVVYLVVGVPRETGEVRIVGIAKGSPAEKAGLREDDWIVAVEGTTISKPDELTKIAGEKKGHKVVMTVERGGEVGQYEIEAREKPPEGEGAMGVSISNTVMDKIAWYEIHRGIGAGFKEAFFWGKIIFDGVGKMVGGLLTGQVPSDVAGPIGMYQATSSIRKGQGLLAVMHFFGIVSVNLAVVNILPFPALDGGRIMFVLYELVTRRRANQKVEILVNNIGMMFLLGVILLVTVADIVRVIR